MSRRVMRWWGWGDEAHPSALPPHADDLLRAELGVETHPMPHVPLEAVRLPEAALGEAARAALERVATVRDDREARVLHAAGKGTVDLLRLRAGDGDPAPDAVVVADTPAAVRAVLEACAEHGVAVVPFGGGTSVVGGVEPLRGDHHAVVALDLAPLDHLDVDARSLLATAGAGLALPDLEERLGARGLTLGHFPQSFMHATVGGCVATRSAGQASTGYGRIDKNVRGVRLAAPAGELHLPPFPGTAAGPDLRQLVVGSEGVLGVITEATLAARPAPAVRRYEGLVFASFAEGVEAFRRCAQLHAAPDVARLSDEDETRLTLALAGSGAKQRALAAYLRVRGLRTPCLCIAGFEGEEDDVRRRRVRTMALLRKGGGIPLGTAPGRAWEHGRYVGPYLRDDLLDRGVMAETLETAHTWSRLDDLYRGVRGALQARASLVGCHVSHLYDTGASLYFTFLVPLRAGEERAQWRAAKDAASEAIVAAGGTITHHHSVGVDHAPWLRHEAGEAGIAALRAAKERLDPTGVMNPGKLTTG